MAARCRCRPGYSPGEGRARPPGMNRPRAPAPRIPQCPWGSRHLHHVGTSFLFSAEDVPSWEPIPLGSISQIQVECGDFPQELRRLWFVLESKGKPPRCPGLCAGRLGCTHHWALPSDNPRCVGGSQLSACSTVPVPLSSTVAVPCGSSSLLAEGHLILQQVPNPTVHLCSDTFSRIQRADPHPSTPSTSCQAFSENHQRIV